MEAVHGLRVSEGPICAAAAPKDLLCFGTTRSPTDGSSELDVSLWSWAGSSDGKNFYDSNHSKQRPVRSPYFWTQVDYLRAALEILSHRPEFFTPKQPVLTQSRLDAPSSAIALLRPGRSVCDYGKKRRMPVPMPHFGMPWIRSADLGLIFNGMVEDKVWGGSMDPAPRCFEVSPLSVAHIWDFTISVHCFNRGLADYVMQMRDSLNRSPDLGNGSSDRAKHCRTEVDLIDLARSRQKQNGVSRDPEHKSEKRDLIKADTADLKQIFIRSTECRHVCMQIWERMSVLELKKEIQDKLGILVALQILLFSGLCLQDQHTLQHYKVAKDSTIILNH